MAARGSSAGIHATECGRAWRSRAWRTLKTPGQAWSHDWCGPTCMVPAVGRLPLHGPARASADRLLRRDRFDDAVEDLVERANAVDDGQLAMLAIELDHRRGLLVVDLQP